MKRLWKWRVVLTGATTLVILGTSCGSVLSGGVDSGGGEIKELRSTSLNRLVSGLKEDLQEYVRRTEPGALQNEEDRRAYRELLDLGLVKALESAQFHIEEECRDSGGMLKSASTEVGKIGAPICLSRSRLVQGESTERDVYGMAIHEIAHQLGVLEEDRAYALGEALSVPIASSLYFKPREGRERILLPAHLKGADGKQCLNIRDTVFNSRVKWVHSEPEPTQFVGRTPSVWFQTWVWESWGHPKPQARAVRPAETQQYDAIYQPDCERIVIRQGNEVLREVPIFSYSPVHLEVGSVIQNGAHYAELRTMITLPEGPRGNKMAQETWYEVHLQLNCKDGSKKTERAIFKFRSTTTAGYEDNPSALSVEQQEAMHSSWRESDAPMPAGLGYPDGCRAVTVQGE